MSPQPGHYLHTDGCRHELVRTKAGWQMRRLSTVSQQWSGWYAMEETAIQKLFGFGHLTLTTYEPAK